MSFTLPRDRSPTTSSRSSTPKRPTGRFDLGVDTDVQWVKGVGPALGALLKSRGITTVRDLLFFFPRAYEDRSQLKRVSELTEGDTASVKVRVIGARQTALRGGRGRRMMEARVVDATDGAPLVLKWFYAPRGMAERFKEGQTLVVTGTPKGFMNRMEMVHPEISWGEGDAYNVGRIVPIYTELEGVPTRTLRKVLWEAVQGFASFLSEDLPEAVLERHGFPRLSQCVREIHFPEKATPELFDFHTPAHQRLIYEEFLKFEYLVLRQRLKMEKSHSPAFPNTPKAREAATVLENALPFRLTAGQTQALQEIAGDLAQPHPMNRLIQGDVGSGKTAVAFLAAGRVLADGGQAALMAPTEILAEQHYNGARRIFGDALPVALLTGKTPAADRALLHAQLAAGAPMVLIGTHALIEDAVQFARLDLVLIDEQHRFGVEQRRTLRNKGARIDEKSGHALVPHTLILTATPIPRTLALTAYGDLAVSSIRGLPPGRSPVATHVIKDSRLHARAIERIRTEIKDGRQAYFIFPLVNESEAEGFEDLKSATAEAERLAAEVFPEFKVGLLHGQMKPDEKSEVMARFQRNELQILVSTTVIEVGVDVPNATVMAIEHSERFGLSQLHQLRGRVGRGTHKSYCFLFTHPNTSEQTAHRLGVLESTSDGFKISEADLEIRGPGEFLGTRQSGGLAFRLANLVRDRDWLLRARDDAEALLRTDPELETAPNLPLRKYFEREGQIQFERLKTS